MADRILKVLDSIWDFLRIKKAAIKSVGAILICAFVISAMSHKVSHKIFMEIYGFSKNRPKLSNMINFSWDINATTGFKFEKFIEVPVSTPLTEACNRDDYETVLLLLKKGASVNIVDGEITSPLYRAVGSSDKSLQIVKLLLRNGADPNGKAEVSPYYPILVLARAAPSDPLRIKNYLEIFELLVQHGAELVDEDGTNILMNAAGERNAVLVQYLVDNSYFDINDQSHRGTTALMMATYNPEVVEILLSHGADKAIKNIEGKTAYDYAVEKGNDESARLLKLD